MHDLHIEAWLLIISWSTLTLRLTACRELCSASAIMLHTGRPLQLQSVMHCMDSTRIGLRKAAGGRPGNAPRIHATATVETPTSAAVV